MAMPTSDKSTNAFLLQTHINSFFKMQMADLRVALAIISRNTDPVILALCNDNTLCRKLGYFIDPVSGTAYRADAVFQMDSISGEDKMIFLIGQRCCHRSENGLVHAVLQILTDECLLYWAPNIFTGGASCHLSRR